MRSGAEYLAALRDERHVIVNGERVESVGEHPAFRGVCRSIAWMFDFAADPANGMIAPAPFATSGVNRIYLAPTSPDELRARRDAIAKWARLSYGFIGRGPDHVASFLAGFASNPEVFNRAGAQFGDNVRRFHRETASQGLYVAYVIIPPQFDRSKTAKDWEDRFIQVGVVTERDDGIVVRGAQMLGTAASIADYLFVSCIVPLRAGDEDYALSFVVPIAAPGLKLYCRRPYAPSATSVFDYPLSTRFDESDALVVFQDVFVPWENVFVYRNIELVRAQFFETPAHILGNSQAQIRLIEKVKFMLGLARKMAAATAVDQIPTVQEKLGQLASLAAIIEGMTIAAEATAIITNGVACPNRRFLYGAMGLQSELYPRILHLCRELAGGGFLQVPSSSREFLTDDMGHDLQTYLRAATVNAKDRVKLFKATWDAVGSEFGGRHHQYEMFYAGAPHVASGYAFRNYGYEEAVAIAEQFLASYDLDVTKESAQGGA